MRVKCIKCNKQCKLSKSKDVDCDKPDCDIKYNMTQETFDFDGLEKEYLKDVIVIEDFTSDEPNIQVVTKPPSVKDWVNYIEGLGMNDGNSFNNY